ncbi:hypothetical protein A2635_02085 [Candidatus Peribacteria bacterium RIFCSPHIGHO2_01_FULL_51_9]|nr:MAG: hypothetical protein A2635_02085 [Candidatus Peribacteria bacterium RIFCSPHIGHO2_01_FULL_51_9]
MFIDGVGDEDEVHVLMKRLAALCAGGNIFEKKSEGFFEHYSFFCMCSKYIFLMVADDLDVETGFFFAFAYRSLFRRFVGVDVPTRRHPSSEALVPQKQGSIL